MHSPNTEVTTSKYYNEILWKNEVQGCFGAELNFYLESENYRYNKHFCLEYTGTSSWEHGTVSSQVGI